MRSATWHTGLFLGWLAAMAPAAADVVLPRSISNNPWLKDLRRSMLAGRALSDIQLQSLADAAEGLAAARYAKRLEEREDPAFLDDAAHYYSIAVYMGRDFAVPRLIAILAKPKVEFGPARLRNIRAVLDRAARRGDAVAAAGLADLLMRGGRFERDIPRARALLLIAAEAGDGKAAISLALSHIQGEPGVASDPDEARRALDLAMESPDPGIRAMALTLQNRLSVVTDRQGVPALAGEVPSGETLARSPSEAFPPRPRPRPAKPGATMP